jgi:hypothetical protein
MKFMLKTKFNHLILNSMFYCNNNKGYDEKYFNLKDILVLFYNLSLRILWFHRN